MTELAKINAKIDRLNAKLKADPIVVVSEWPQATIPGSLTGGTLCEDTLTLVIDSSTWLFEAGRWANEITTLARQPERFSPHLVTLARKIQLAILERLTG